LKYLRLVGFNKTNCENPVIQVPILKAECIQDSFVFYLDKKELEEHLKNSKINYIHDKWFEDLDIDDYLIH